jgi:hypothetical protein
MIILRGLQWTEHVTQIGEVRNAFKILIGNPKVRDHLGNLDVGGEVILKWILKKQNVNPLKVFITLLQQQL